jgi:hypothetical protein
MDIRFEFVTVLVYDIEIFCFISMSYFTFLWEKYSDNFSHHRCLHKYDVSVVGSELLRAVVMKRSVF